MEINNKIYELACLYKNNQSEEVALEIEKVLSNYLYAVIKVYAYKNTNIEKIYKISFLKVLEIIKKYDFVDCESLIDLIKRLIRQEIKLLIVEMDN